MGGMLLMCQNTTMQVYGARIKGYCVLCSKHIAIRVVLSYPPAGSRQAAWWRPYLWDWFIPKFELQLNSNSRTGNGIEIENGIGNIGIRIENHVNGLEILLLLLQHFIVNQPLSKA